MSRETWTLIKQSKRFYVTTYRKAGTALLFSAILNVILIIGIYYAHFNQFIPAHYATNGITPPEMISPMKQPNYGPTPLLPNDPENDDQVRAIPQ